jgi:hypothetical protein
MTDSVSLTSPGDMQAGQDELRPARQTYSTRSRLVKMGHHSLTRREGEDG